MLERFYIEFVVDLPNKGVVKDVEIRLTRENLPQVVTAIQAAIGYEPLCQPGQRGINVGHDEVKWDSKAKGWRGDADK